MSIEIKDSTVLMPKEEWETEKELNYLNFVLGYDLLQDMFKKEATPECDTNYDFCDYLSRKFIKTDNYRNEKCSTYESLDRWTRDNKDLIYSEYLYSIGLEDKKILEVGDRNDRSIALVRWNKSGREEYLVAFEYKITDNKLHWGYGYYYDENFDKAKEDFNKVRNGGNLSDTFKKKNDRGNR